VGLNQKYGDICEFRLGGYRRIFLTKTDHFDDLLSPSKNLALFTKVEYISTADKFGNFGRGMFLNNNYDSWKINKSFLLQSISTPGFNKEAIKNTNELFKELDGYWNLLRKSQSSNDDWLEIDFSPWINRFMTDNISIIATGEHGCSMESYYSTFNSDKSKHKSFFIDNPELYNSDRFAKAIATYKEGLTFFYFIHPFLIRHVPFFKNKANAFLESNNYMTKTLNKMIEGRKFDFANTPQKLNSKNDLLTLITSNHDAKSKVIESLADEDIRALLLDVFLAGSDTVCLMSSYTLCSVIYYICRNPRVKQKLFDEIDSVFPNDSSGTLCITAENLTKLKYCEAIIKEACRIAPIAPVIRRVASAECEVAGYTWPAKTIFYINLASLHMDEKYWPNPTVFDPDRFYLQNNLGEFNGDLGNFENENKKSIHNKNKYSLIMFGGGIRICPGRKLAMLNMLTFMALMFKKYDVELTDMEAPLKTHTGFITNCL
ncbi:9901_t:CDS:2, partial [Cetraspora pellucida]